MAAEVKNLPANAGDVGLIPGLGRSAGERNGSALQYSCLGNPMDRAWDWWAMVHGVTRVHLLLNTTTYYIANEALSKLRARTSWLWFSFDFKKEWFQF